MKQVRRLLILLLVLGLLLVVGDRVAAGVAAGEAEKRLVANGFRDPSVRIHEFPFLLQLAQRRFRHVSVSAGGLRAGEDEAVHVRAELRDARARSTGSAEVGDLSAVGTVPYAEVVRAVGVPAIELGPGPRGEVRLRRTVEVLGIRYTVAARGRIEARGTHLLVVPTAIELEGSGALDDRLSTLLTDRAAIDYPISGLPRGLRVDRVTATADGFVVQVSGRDVVLKG